VTDENRPTALGEITAAATVGIGSDELDREVERYELFEPCRYRFEPSRREFVQLCGAGLVLVIGMPPAAAQRGSGRGARASERLSQRFHLAASGTITVFSSKVEVGQGSRTQIAQAVAEEFQLPLDRVQVVLADTERCPDDGGTAGSRTTPSTVPRVRQAAAAARTVLTQLAAERLGADTAGVAYRDGTWTTEASRAVSLAELAGDTVLGERLAAATAADEAEIRPVAAWQVLGKSAPKVNGRDVVTGAHQYPSDVVRPGMLYGRMFRPVAYGAKLVSIDESAARSLDGVVVVRDGDSFVGCAAPNSWLARQACEALARTAQWETVEHIASDRLYEHLKQTGQPRRAEGRNTRQWGELESALEGAAQTWAAEYQIAYLQHAPMEPRAAVAEWSRDGRLTVWTGTQQPSRVRSELQEAFRLSAEQVRVIVPDTGGGFGGKHSGEAAVEAARLARGAGRPVHLRWTREEEFTWAYFRPAGVIEVRGGLDGQGRLAAWDFVNYNSGGSAIETPYQAAAGRTMFVAAEAPLRQGSYRALASTANTFARESAMDELAGLLQADPLEFRLQHLDEGRLKDVLRAAADRFNWPERRAQRSAGRGVGMACGTEKGSYVAACVSVEVVNNSIRVMEVVQAYECGAIQNPANLRSQVVGCLIMGLGGALSEEIHFSGGTISNASFSSYHVPRMVDVPPLDIVLLDRPDLPSVGAGETPIIAIAPAIANAVFDATGVRSRQMPLKLA
jgi:isoquinoline 1-oxidoreductase